MPRENVGVTPVEGKQEKKKKKKEVDDRLSKSFFPSRRGKSLQPPAFRLRSPVSLLDEIERAVNLTRAALVSLPIAPVSR